MKNSETKSLVYAAILLALCICSQFLKNVSVYITGPIINTCLIVCVITAGLKYAISLSVITPVTSFFITGSPIMSAIPLIIPCVMLGNIILVLCVYFGNKNAKKKYSLPVSFVLGSILKGVFMGTSISLIIIPLFIPEKLLPMKAVFQTTFSLTQFVTAFIGGAIAYIIMPVLKKTMKYGEA